ncbi:MAG: dipeptide ABC transporter ATP-binding protein [Burkholderiaceae bacterium]
MTSDRAMAADRTPLLEVRNLSVDFETRHGRLRAIDHASFDVGSGEVLGIVGESGAGKSLTGAAIMGLIEPPGRIAGGQIRLRGARIDDLPAEALRRLRGKQLGAIFQDPLTSLNPLYTVGRQLIETIVLHQRLSQSQARRHAIELLAATGLPAPAARIDHYPHQFSGGMRQRVVIALALAGQPSLVVADEPTTALDVSIQAQITTLLKRLCRDRGTSVLLITHDMGVIAETADRVAVMYAGRIAEIGPVLEVLHRPRHPYTAGLMGSIPSLSTTRDRLLQIDGAMPRLDAIPAGCAFHPRCPHAMPVCREQRPPPLDDGAVRVACWLMHPPDHLPAGRRAAPVAGSAAAAAPTTATATATSIATAAATVTAAAAAAPAEAAPTTTPSPHAAPLLDVDDLSKTFDLSAPWLTRMLERQPRRRLKAVDGVSFSIRRGETLALVGESGCGKSTVARLLVGLHSPDRGRIRFDETALARTGGRAAADASPQHRRQMIFQDPYASLNPRWTVAELVAEPIRTQQLIDGDAQIRTRVDELLIQVGLSPADARKFPHQFSGGQRQRISIARAVAGEPAFLVCDEPTSALDVSVQAQVLNLIRDLQQRHRLTCLFISHNLAVVHHISDQVGVMYLGRLVEQAPKADLFAAPRHPYTRLLLDAVPDVTLQRRERQPLAGEVPDPLAPPVGCGFHPRCPHADERCRRERPLLKPHGRGSAACHAVEEGRLSP